MSEGHCDAGIVGDGDGNNGARVKVTGRRLGGEQRRRRPLNNNARRPREAGREHEGVGGREAAGIRVSQAMERGRKRAVIMADSHG